MRVLHLLAPPPSGAGRDAATLACAAAIRRLGSLDHTACLIGGGGAEERSASLGLLTSDRIAPALGLPVLAWQGLRRFVRDRGPFDTVQCWCTHVVEVATRALGHRARIVGPPNEVLLAAAAADAHRSAVDRATARRSLGLAEDATAFALLADPPRTADARGFIFTVGLIDIAGETVCGVVDGSSSAVGRARRFHARAQVDWRLLVTRAPVASLLAAFDAAAVLSSGPGATAPGPIALAAAAHLAGVPVVASGGFVNSGVYPQQARADCTAGYGSPAAIAGALMSLIDDPPRHRALSEMVRDHAARFVEDSNYPSELEAAWSGRAVRSSNGEAAA